MKKEQPKFFVFIVEPNGLGIRPIDVMQYLCSIPARNMKYWYHDIDKKDVPLKDCTLTQATQTISRQFASRYWSRYEYEMDISGHCELSWIIEKNKNCSSPEEIISAFESFEQFTIDAYDQIKANLDLIVRIYLEYKGLYKRILKNSSYEKQS